jgi:hypothetical protein
MATEIRSAELVVTNEEAGRDELLGYYEVEIYGLKSRLHGKNFAQANFGSFEATDDRSILYSATVYAGDNGHSYHDYDSEFCDDLAMLENDLCQVFD